MTWRHVMSNACLYSAIFSAYVLWFGILTYCCTSHYYVLLKVTLLTIYYCSPSCASKIVLNILNRIHLNTGALNKRHLMALGYTGVDIGDPIWSTDRLVSFNTTTLDWIGSTYKTVACKDKKQVWLETVNYFWHHFWKETRPLMNRFQDDGKK